MSASTSAREPDPCSRENHRPHAVHIEGMVDLLRVAALLPARYPALFESSAVSQSTGRFDFLFLHQGPAITAATPADGARFLRDLASAFACEAISRGGLDADAITPPFQGGWLLFLGYEMASVFEPGLRLPAVAGSAMPTALALRCPAAIVVDRHHQCSWLLAESDRADLIDVMRGDLLTATDYQPRALPAARISEADPLRFIEDVSSVREHIAAGDVFQVNLSRRWDVEFASAPRAADVLHALRLANPAPFAGLLQWGDAWLVSSSPERLVAVEGDTVSTRPIAGTRARRPGEDDEARRHELLAHPKERAEHVMLVDLERNDLGRVCEPGSIEVSEMMTLESYAHVHHIVSSVRGRLSPSMTSLDVMAAVFPGGTITGAPKVECMRIIAALEGEGRGVYTGSMGWLDRRGDMDLNILIRTFEGAGNRAWFRAGAGIVADSDAWAELAETRAKAHGLLSALETEA